MPLGPSPKRSLVPHPPFVLYPNSRQGHEPALQGRVTMSTPTTVSSYVGIDISKNRLDVHVRPAGTAFSVPRDPDGLTDLVRPLVAFSPCRIVVAHFRSGAPCIPSTQAAASRCNAPRDRKATASAQPLAAALRRCATEAAHRLARNASARLRAASAAWPAREPPPALLGHPGRQAE